MILHKQSDVLLVVPPFFSLVMPNVAVHSLKAAAKEQGIGVDILYANVHFAGQIGLEQYETIARSSVTSLFGEQCFAESAYGAELAPKRALQSSVSLPSVQVTQEWSEAVATWICQSGYRIVGCTSSFQQTNASISLFRAVKIKNPDTICILGGANCEGEMGKALKELTTAIDIVVSGEGERSFAKLVGDILAGSRPPQVVIGESVQDLDSVPQADYTEFYEQISKIDFPSDFMWLPYETSRGCWWGQKSHCTFCGLNARNIAHRQKTPRKVITELRTLLERHPNRRIFMLDNIMPYSYFADFLPLLHELMPIELFYEQKANLSYDRLASLKDAGVVHIQPGIESLSSDLLRLMKKGVTAWQNAHLLRNARIFDIDLHWSLLVDFPGDQIEHYTSTSALIPLLRHLQPPGNVSRLVIDRFSPYFDRPAEHGINNVIPLEAYARVFPPRAPIHKLAYHFTAEYPSVARLNRSAAADLEAVVEAWQMAWYSETRPVLFLSPIASDSFVLIDTRGLPDTKGVQTISLEQARAALFGLCTAETAQWAQQSKVVALIDGKSVPLATSSRETFEKMRQTTSYLEMPQQQFLRVLLPVA